MDMHSYAERRRQTITCKVEIVLKAELRLSFSQLYRISRPEELRDHAAAGINFRIIDTQTKLVYQVH